MNYGKKIAALLLAVALVLSLAVTASAETANTGSITIMNPQSGQTYTAYKIFDVVYSGDNYAYTISNTSLWFSTVQTYANTSENGLTLTASANDNTVYVVTTTENFNAAKFAAALKEASVGDSGTQLSSSDGGTTVSAANLPLGYYFVKSTSGTLCNLTTTNPMVQIYDKNETPTIDKTVDDEDKNVDIGQVVTYTITGKVPDTTGYTAYTYTISDTMSGLKLNGVYSVSIDSVEIANNSETGSGESNVTGTRPSKDAISFKINIDVMKYQKKVGKEIKITYQAVVSEDAVTGSDGNTNNAELTYSNNPSDSVSTDTSTDKETVYTVDLVITKVDANNNQTKLSGAKFVLYKGAKGVPTHYYKWDSDAKKVTWVRLGQEGVPGTLEEAIAGGYVTEVTTAETTGLATFKGLAAGTYYLHETQAPDGYNALTEDEEVTITRSESQETVTISGDTVTVENSSGSQLPGTGGIGTTIFYVVGGVIMAGAVILLLLKKHAEN